MLNRRKRIDDILAALSEPSRRGIIEALSEGPLAMSQLAERLDLSLPGLIQHLAVLTNVQLIETEKTGRVRTVTLRPEAFADLEFWISCQRNNWHARLNNLQSYLDSNNQKKDKEDGA